MGISPLFSPKLAKNRTIIGLWRVLTVFFAAFYTRFTGDADFKSWLLLNFTGEYYEKKQTSYGY
jgi:hypothetical protein